MIIMLARDSPNLRLRGLGGPLRRPESWVIENSFELATKTVNRNAAANG